MSDDRPLGTIQVDVDELWVYYESIGRPAPASAPSPAYDQGVPRLLDLFERFGIQATFFVCGRDLSRQAKIVAEMAARGHEIANHTQNHPAGFARLGLEQQRQEISAAHQAIAAVAGRPPTGFKSPGFSFSSGQLALLAELGYHYDSSILPTPYAPLLRSIQRLLSGGRVDPTHYGRAIHGLAPLRPYRPDPIRPHRTKPAEREKADDSALFEAPITTMPFLRLPIHSTFVLSTGRPLFDLGLALIRRRHLPVNYLLHAADAIDPTGDQALASYPFLQQSWAAKGPLLESMLARLSAAYRLVPTRELLTAYGLPITDYGLRINDQRP